MLRIFKVVGESMLPTLQPNDVVITFRFKKLNSKDIIVLNTKSYGNIVKRISFVNKRVINLESDNKDIYSSSCNVTYSIKEVLGKVIFKINSKSVFLKWLSI